MVPSYFENANSFINAIPQDIVVFVDEYEKIYKESNELLTIMDGVLNAPYRRVFLMTTNNLHIENNLIDRPSRVRYLKTFSNLSPDIVEEIIDDLLINKEFKDDCIIFASTLEIITVDIIKSIINEVNIQEESPLKFKNVFNASTKKGKYKVFTQINDKIELFKKGVKISPRINFGEHTIGSGFYIDETYVGSITEVIDFNTVKVEIYESEVESDVSDSDSDSDEIMVLQKISSGNKLSSGKRRRKTKTKIVTPFDLPKGEVTFTVQEDYSINDIYKYGINSTYATGHGEYIF